jgi:hypothetical protein
MPRAPAESCAHRPNSRALALLSPPPSAASDASTVLRKPTIIAAVLCLSALIAKGALVAPHFDRYRTYPALSAVS